MAQDYAQLLRSIWTDEDFRALSVDAQHAYMMLFSHPDRNAAGVLSLTLRKWTRLASDLHPDRLDMALTELDATRFIVMDESTEELCVRSFIRRASVYKHIRLLANALREVSEVESPRIRSVLAQELARLPRLSLPDNEKMRNEAVAAQELVDALASGFTSPDGPGHGMADGMAHPMAHGMAHPPVVVAGVVAGAGAVAPTTETSRNLRGGSHVSRGGLEQPPLIQGRCETHQYDVVAPKCGACKDARIYAEATAIKPALALVSSRPDWCGDCDQFTRLRNYDSVPYRCPECHPLANQESA
jgi:hypothetical protein